MSSTPADSRLLPHIAGPSEFQRAFDVSRETLDRLGLYADLLAKWQKAVNLVAPGTLDEVWHRHFADSAQLVALAPDTERWIDLGSGGGFPGLVIAIMRAGAEPADVTLVESDARKCAFLREVARQTGVAVDIVNARSESFSTQARISEGGVVSARALAPLDRLLELSVGLFSRGTVGLFPKGREFRSEIEAAQRRWQFASNVVPSRTDKSGRIVEVRALRAKTEG
jgi:16S rRNA (guanine527-N7)-methyltransferase